MGIQTVKCGLPCWASAAEEQTKCSLITRILAVVLGGIALLVGILALSGIPAFSALGTVGGSVLIIAGGLSVIVGICLRCVEKISTQQIKAVRNAINWKSIIEGDMTETGSMREPEAVDRIEALLKAAPMTTCPYTKIFVTLARESAPILTFEEDGWFSKYSPALPCAAKNILFLHIPTSKARSEHFKIYPHFSTSRTHPEVKVSYILYEEWCSGQLSTETLKRLGFS
jgi:hypothetical protein